MDSGGTRKHILLDGAKILHAKAIIRGNHARARSTTLCCELCKNGWTDRFAIGVVDLGGPKEAQVQSYLPGGTNGRTHRCHLANTIESSICSGAAALCQITLTTCLKYSDYSNTVANMQKGQFTVTIVIIYTIQVGKLKGLVHDNEINIDCKISAMVWRWCK